MADEIEQTQVEAAPVQTEAPAETQTVETATAEQPERTPTLLENIPIAGTEEVKETVPSDAPKADAPEKPAEEGAEAKVEGDAAKPETEAAPVELPAIEYKYEIPEGLILDEALKGDFHKALDEFRRDPEKGAQSFLNMHKDAMARHADFQREEQFRIFNETKKEWVNRVMSDDEIGGAGHQTAMTAISRMRDKFLSSAPAGSAKYKQDLLEFQEFLAYSGAGDNPAFLRFLHNVAQVYDEPQAYKAPTEIKPPPQPRKLSSVLHDRTTYNGQ